jgi:hypothetical protein
LRSPPKTRQTLLTPNRHPTVGLILIRLLVLQDHLHHLSIGAALGFETTEVALTSCTGNLEHGSKTLLEPGDAEANAVLLVWQSLQDSEDAARWSSLLQPSRADPSGSTVLRRQDRAIGGGLVSVHCLP